MLSYAKRCELLSIWVFAPTEQEQRRRLETHLSLLSQESDRPLHDLLADSIANRDDYSHLYRMQHLLHDIRLRGGTLDAIREAYVNEYGGFVLELPAWLADIEYCVDRILPLSKQTDRVRTHAKFLLREALERGYRDSRVAPEVLAELHYRLGYEFFIDLYDRSVQQVDTVVEHFEIALQVYTQERYPKQSAKLASALESLRLHPQGPDFRLRLRNR